MIRIGVILGSTRPGRNGEAVAKWVYAHAQKRSDAEFELVDLMSFHLPLLDEAIPASAGRYANEHTKAWAAKVASLDAFVIVTPEYNHGVPAALKNAIDFLFAEWNNKVVGFVSYGSAGGARAVEHLRGVFAEVMVATVRQQVLFNLANDFENWTVMKKPDAAKEKALTTLLDQVVAWGTALKSVRTA